ncbi:MAG: hypothetical protein CL943_03780 [Candidatus Diapherotrites archaeon]|uniref:HMA domain-containing protein n=1 Tax=Candidatus Iainarchaeum sp. TaxID=3101447 RepID=A0A2D6M1U3_9ARCH|nr:hypothetical protein [Candidatus Diapherotrites archaeon]
MVSSTTIYGFSSNVCGDFVKKEVSLKISGMHCTSCEKLIQDGLLELEGVETVQVSFANEKAKVVFDDKKVSLDKIEGEVLELGYEVKGSSDSSTKTKNTTAQKMSIRQGIVYGLVPHIGCIGFIVASILGATIAVEFFKPLLMNPWFFHILILISIGFATLSSAFYLRKQGIFSMQGIKRKKKYLATMYGSTVGINLILFLVIFPMLANLDTGSFANPTGMVTLAGAQGNSTASDSLLRLQSNIPCPGHAPLISGELKSIEGITGVKYEFPNYFDVAFDSSKTSKDKIFALEVFEIYTATLISESLPDPEEKVSFAAIQEVESLGTGNVQPSGTCGGTCGGGCGGCGCGG